MLDLDDFEEHEFDEEEIRIRHEQKQREEQLAAEKKRLLAQYSKPTPGMTNLEGTKSTDEKESEPVKHGVNWGIIVLVVIGIGLLTWFLIEYGATILMGACVILWLIVEFFKYPFKRR